MDQKIINLYDRFIHGGLSRREFLDRLAEIAGSAAAATTLLGSCRAILPEPRPSPPTIPGSRPSAFPTILPRDASLVISCAARP